jgi:hypothetical protein
MDSGNFLLLTSSFLFLTMHVTMTTQNTGYFIRCEHFQQLRLNCTRTPDSVKTAVMLCAAKTGYKTSTPAGMTMTLRTYLARLPTLWRRAAGRRPRRRCLGGTDLPSSSLAHPKSRSSHARASRPQVALQRIETFGHNSYEEYGRMAV